MHSPQVERVAQRRARHLLGGQVGQGIVAQRARLVALWGHKCRWGNAGERGHLLGWQGDRHPATKVGALAPPCTPSPSPRRTAAPPGAAGRRAHTAQSGGCSWPAGQVQQRMRERRGVTGQHRSEGAGEEGQRCWCMPSITAVTAATARGRWPPRAAAMDSLLGALPAPTSSGASPASFMLRSTSMPPATSRRICGRGEGEPSGCAAEGAKRGS